MANSKALFNHLKSKITIDESESEIDSILLLLLEKKTGITRTDLMVSKEIDITFDIDSIIERINNCEPIQYILGQADFFGSTFLVNKDVLIPRPETELLVEQTISELTQHFSTGTIVDIGTGSGCIAITLAKKFSQKKVFGIDISKGAIALATENARLFRCDAQFVCHDILAKDLPFYKLECIISNPPYITQSEEKFMRKNVIAYEPAAALFVTDHDPLIFYRRILESTIVSLKENGLLIVEINERFGNEVVALFEQYKFSDIQIKKDFDGKDRIVYGRSN
jgi:release factor glutamine methyltransferase